MAITLSYNGTITVADSVTGTVAYSKILQSLSTAGTSFGEVQPGTFGTSPTSITLPISPATFFYFKNTHAVNTITLTWTPNGGASNVVVTLQPGGFIGFSEPSALSGITALSVTANGASTTVEYLIGG